MKYTKRIVLLLFFIIALGISNVYATKGTVTTDGVRIRKEPSTSADIVTVLNKDATVEIIEEANGWYKIKYTDTGKYEGYMSKDFIKTDGEVNQTTPVVAEPTETPTETPTVNETTLPTENEDTKTIQLGEKILNNNGNIYILPVITSSIKDTIKVNTEVVVQEIAGNFAYIKYNNKYGWVRISLLQDKIAQPNESTNVPTTEKKGYVNVTQAIVRKSATTSSEMITALNFNSEVTIIGEENDFYKILINNQEYYIAKRLISDTKQQVTNRGTSTRETQISNVVVVNENDNNQQLEEIATSTTTSAPTSSVGAQISQLAQGYVGYKYVYGGASPSSGFDCSGLVYYICGQLGYKVNRTADAQVNNGVYVEKTNLQPGDLVFFSNYKTYTGIGHVGIYIGDNKFVHASTATTGVIISSLNEATYIKRYVTARRIGV